MKLADIIGELARALLGETLVGVVDMVCEKHGLTEHEVTRREDRTCKEGRGFYKRCVRCREEVAQEMIDECRRFRNALAGRERG